MDRTVLAEMDFGPWPEASDEAWLSDADQAFEGLMGNFHRNSQIIGDAVRGVVQGRLKAFVRLPAPDALVAHHASTYVRKDLDKCIIVFGSEPQITIMDEGACKALPTWREALYLVVYGGTPDGLAPVRNESFDCIPSYLLPIDERDSEGLCFWARDERRLLGLWFSGQLEEETLRAMADPRSDHKQRCRELAATLEQATGKKVYIDLFRHYGLPGDLEANRPCPLCGKGWRVQDEHWAFRCEPCRLVSDLACAEDENGWASIGTWSQP